MLRRWRLRRAHARFLESSRNLQEGRSYWDQAGGLRRWFLETLSPVPLVALQGDGLRLLETLHWLEANCRLRALDESLLREYGRRILKDGAEPTGSYRRGAISVIGSSVPRPPAAKVPALMRHLDLKLQEDQKSFDASGPEESAVLASAVVLHQRIAYIHPFVDGNGRVARLAMNHLLRRYGMGYSILPPVNESTEHMDALEAAHRGDLEPLTRLVRSCLFRI